MSTSRGPRTFALALVLAPCACGERKAQQALVHRDSVVQVVPARSLGDADSDQFLEPHSLSPDTGPRYVVNGACPFECCQYGRWTLQTTATLRAAPAQGSDSLGVIETGSTVRADSGVVVMHPVGLDVITQVSSGPGGGDSIGFAVGDTVEVLNYEGEGSFRIRWRGREFSGQSAGWNTTTTHTVREPVGSWWVHMTDSASQRRGWVLVSQRQGIELIKVVRSAGSDACG